MNHSMKLVESAFNSIKQGTKTVEMRLYDEKRRKIIVGDIIEFTNIKTDEKIKVKVIHMSIFDSFKSLYNEYDKVSIGYEKDEEASPNDMEKFYTKEDIKKYGVVAIEIELI